jgi:DNA-binding MarR family transcriptional regulator
MNTPPQREEQLVLELLDVVGKKSDVSQRHLASQMGVALGLANSYLKRCIRKGLIKISAAPANRYLYYLTPKGFAEKSRLTAKYLSTSFEFYRRAGDSCMRVYDRCQAEGWCKIVLCGVSDLAEIATLRAIERNIEILGTFDPHVQRQRFLGKPVWHSAEDIGVHDAMVLTDLATPSMTFEHVIGFAGKEKLLVPDILRLD